MFGDSVGFSKIPDSKLREKHVYCRIQHTHFSLKLPNIFYPEDYHLANYQSPPSTCFIFHDIDLVPISDKNLYTCFEHTAIHLCDKIDRYSYLSKKISGGKFSAGGILSISQSMFQEINGFPNRYFGWGLEDHDISDRLLRYKKWYNFSLESDSETENSDSEYHSYQWYFLDNFSEDGGSRNYVKNSRQGYYNQYSHDKTISKPINNLYLDSDFESFKHFTGVGYRPLFFQIDGYSNLNYTVSRVNTDIETNTTMVTSDVREFLPTMVKIRLNNSKNYKILENSTYSHQNDPCQMIQLNHTYSKGAQLLNTVTYQKIRSRRDIASRKLQCLQPAADGQICSLIDQKRNLVGIPWPIFYDNSLEKNFTCYAKNCETFYFGPEIYSKEDAIESFTF